MIGIDCVLNEQLCPIAVCRTEDTNFYTAVYEEMSKEPLLDSITGVAFLAKGDDAFHFETNGTMHVVNAGDRHKIIDGYLDGKTLTLRWVGKPDMVFVNYLIEKIRVERHSVNWLKEGF